VLIEYLQLWTLLENSNVAQLLFDDQQDSVLWRWTENGAYSASSAYQMQLAGRIPSTIFPQVWKVKATPSCRLHAWLLFHNKCLTADNLAIRGWPHNPICRLCFTHPETAVHLSATCPYSRIVWQHLLFRLHLPVALAPAADIEHLEDWWTHCSTVVPNNILKRWRTLAVLTWRLLWKERNNRIFNALACTEAALTDKVVEELSQWRDAGILGASWPEGE
jgi:hypothetical protein